MDVNEARQRWRAAREAEQRAAWELDDAERGERSKDDREAFRKDLKREAARSAVGAGVGVIVGAVVGWLIGRRS
jgi:hypothetical protein